MDAIAPYWKAVLGFIAPGVTVLMASVLEASDGGTRITSSELVTAIGTAIVTAAAVYTVPNKARRRASAKKRAPAVDPDPPEHRAGGPVI